MTSDQVELILIFLAVITGVVSAAYFYLSTDVFLGLMKRPLKFVSLGMFVIAIGVLLAAFISYESKQGIQLYFYNIPLQAIFYILYIIGSLMIGIGARQFTKRPTSQVADVSLHRI